MTLYINTTSPDEIIIALQVKGEKLDQRRLSARRTQAEKLLPAIDRLLKAKRTSLRSLKKIVVANQGGSFTSLRIGVITANALAYALKIPIEAAPATAKNIKKFQSYSLVEPLYDRAPTIGISKKLKL